MAYAIQPRASSSKHRMRYRWTRLVLSRWFRVLISWVLPLGLLGLIIFQIWSSQLVRERISSTYDDLYQSLAYSPMFRIDKVTIHNATNLREEEILAALNLPLPNSTFFINHDEIIANLSGDDAVGDIQLRMVGNGEMELILKPRIPVLIYKNDAQFLAIDATGHKVESLNSRLDRPEFFVIAGEGAADAAEEALKITNVLAPIASNVRGLVRVGDRRWDIVLVNGAKLMLPAKRPLTALKTIIETHQATDILNRNITHYDMRNPEYPNIAMNNAAWEAYDIRQNPESEAARAMSAE